MVHTHGKRKEQRGARGKKRQERGVMKGTTAWDKIFGLAKKGS